MNKPRRQLTLLDAVCLIVGVIIGAGIYECAPTVASAAGSPAGVIGFWVLGGLISLCGALCYAELATAYPRAGGDYEYLTRAYGPQAGFLFGWFQVALIRPGDIALLALVFSSYALAMFPDFFPTSQIPFWYRFLAVCGVILLTAVHIIGVRHGKLVQNGLTTIKVLGVLAVVLLAFLGGRQLVGSNSSTEPSPAASVSSEDQVSESNGTELVGAVGGASFGLALIFVLFTYGGWNEMAYLAAEIEHPEKNILRGLVLGACGVMGIYLLMNGAFLYALGMEGLAGSEAVAVDAVSGVLPTLGQSVISASICISALGAVSALIFTGSRIAYAIGQDYPLFAFLGQWHPKSETPMRALVFQALLSSLMIIILGGFEETLIYTSAAVYCFFLASCLSVMVLRWREPHVHRPYRVIGYPWTVIVFAAACLFLIYSAVNYRPRHGLALIVMLVLGSVIYRFQGATRRAVTHDAISDGTRLEPSHAKSDSRAEMSPKQSADEPESGSNGDRHA